MIYPNVRTEEQYISTSRKYMGSHQGYLPDKLVNRRNGLARRRLENANSNINTVYDRSSVPGHVVIHPGRIGKQTLSGITAMFRRDRVDEWNEVVRDVIMGPLFCRLEWSPMSGTHAHVLCDAALNEDVKGINRAKAIVGYADFADNRFTYLCKPFIKDPYQNLAASGQYIEWKEWAKGNGLKLPRTAFYRLQSVA